MAASLWLLSLGPAAAESPCLSSGKGDQRLAALAETAALTAEAQAALTEIEGEIADQRALVVSHPCADDNALDILEEAEEEVAKAQARFDNGEPEAALDDLAEAREELTKLQERLAKLSQR
jgi:hypothetical protein